MPFALIALILLVLAGTVELAFLVQVAGWIGILPTIVLLIGVSIAGMLLIRRQGVATLMRLQGALQQGRMPVVELFDAACLVAAGILLTLPGFISDIAACLLLLPPFRSLLYKALARRLQAIEVRGGGRRPGSRRPPAVIEGEYEEIEPMPDQLGPRRER
jgi:UPF0716 protein FxsA